MAGRVARKKQAEILTLAGIKSLARSHARTAIDTLAGLMRDCPKPEVRMQSAIALLDRGFGRPQGDDDATETLTITIRKIFEGPPAGESAPLIEATVVEAIDVPTEHD
jgi:hypothetical protein